MSQSDLNIANVSRSLFRQETNEALQALGSLSSGATEPTTTYAYQLWADTGSGLLKQRNAANDGWISKGNLADVDWGLLNKAGGAMSGLLQLDQSTDITAAVTTDLGTATGNAVTVTHAAGALAITSFGGASLQSGTELTITWSVSGGSLSATYNATSLIVPSAANLPIANGDVWKVQKISDSLAYWRVVDITKADGTPVVGNSVQIRDIDAAVAGNDLTITINPTTLDFRSTTLTDGTPTTVTLSSAVTVTVPSGGTLGTVNNVAARLAVIAINNAGTIEAAVVNLAGGNQLDETNLINTTTIGTGSDSNNVIYSTTGRTSVAYRVLGFIDITQATAGTWASQPTLVQGVGGQALASLSSLGYGQTEQTFAIGTQRVSGVTYYNTTGKPIILSIQAANHTFKIVTGGITYTYSGYGGAGGDSYTCDKTIRPGASYVVNAGSSILQQWSETR